MARGAVALAWLAGSLVVGIEGTAQAAAPPATFAAPTDLAVGAGPADVAIGDLDGDAHPDLVTVRPGADQASVLFANGDGTFAAPVHLATGTKPSAVAIGDLNGDSAPDVVVANYGTAFGEDSSAGVLLNNGDGTFAPHADAGGAVLHLFVFAVDVEIADLDGDANLDLIVIHEQSDVYPEGGLSVLLGEGDGTFGTYIHRVLPPSPTMLAVGDLTGDGDPDLVIAEDLFQDQLMVLLGNGDGTFGDLLPYNDVDDPSGVAIGELDGDGILDVAVAERAQSRVVVLSGDGDGSFSEATDVPTGTQAQSLALGDLNGDTHLDVTTTGLDNAGPNASVLLGNGDGTLDPYTRVPVSSTAGQVTVGDLNGDDRPDLVTANPTAASLSVLLNTTTPGVAGAPTVIRNATAGDGQATVSWTAPASNGGTPITGYVVTPYVGFSPRPATSFSSAATTQSITGLSNGTQYRFRVQAVNAVGISGYSTVTNPVTPTAPTAPEAPTIVRNATAGDAQATVSWTAPASDGGSPVTGYVVTPYVGYSPQPSQTFASIATSQNVTGLTNGTTYRFRVRAINAVGTSGYSTVTNPVTPSA